MSDFPKTPHFSFSPMDVKLGGKGGNGMVQATEAKTASFLALLSLHCVTRNQVLSISRGCVFLCQMKHIFGKQWEKLLNTHSMNMKTWERKDYSALSLTRDWEERNRFTTKNLSKIWERIWKSRPSILKSGWVLDLRWEHSQDSDSWDPTAQCEAWTVYILSF